MKKLLLATTLSLLAACGGSDPGASNLDGSNGDPRGDMDPQALAQRSVSSLSGDDASGLCVYLQLARHEVLTTAGWHNVVCVAAALGRTADECTADAETCFGQCGAMLEYCRTEIPPATPEEAAAGCLGLSPSEYSSCDVTVEGLTDCFAQLTTSHSVFTGVNSCVEAVEAPQLSVSPACQAILDNPGCDPLLWGR